MYWAVVCFVCADHLEATGPEVPSEGVISPSHGYVGLVSTVRTSPSCPLLSPAKQLKVVRTVKMLAQLVVQNQ